MRFRLLVLLGFAVAVVASAAAGAAPIQSCPPRSTGPGALAHGTTAGADCMLRAYRSQCTPAVYELSSFGVDTVATLRFQLVHRPGSCAIDLTRSFRVVPQKPRVTGHGECKALHRTPTDVVAVGCTGSGFPAQVLLTR